MLANEGNPYETRKREMQERLDRASREQEARRAFQGALWVFGGLVLALGVGLISGSIPAGLIVLGVWGLATARLVGESK